MRGYLLQILIVNMKLDNISLVGLVYIVGPLSFFVLFAYYRYLITSFSYKKVVIVLGLLGYNAVLSLGLIGEMWMFI